MKNTIRIMASMLSIVILISISGCGVGGNSKYRVDEKLAEQEFCVGFRQTDKSGEEVIAALEVLQASGKVGEISNKWFKEDVSLLKGDANALDSLSDKIKTRTFINGNVLLCYEPKTD